MVLADTIHCCLEICPQFTVVYRIHDFFSLYWLPNCTHNCTIQLSSLYEKENNKLPTPCYNEIPLLKKGGGRVERRKIEQEELKERTGQTQGLAPTNPGIRGK
jgi:hypothetical protein